jgi:hypothetical protein
MNDTTERHSGMIPAGIHAMGTDPRWHDEHPLIIKFTVY